MTQEEAIAEIHALLNASIVYNHDLLSTVHELMEKYVPDDEQRDAIYMAISDYKDGTPSNVSVLELLKRCGDEHTVKFRFIRTDTEPLQLKDDPEIAGPTRRYMERDDLE